MPLHPPPADLDQTRLPIKEVSVTKLKRIGRRASGEPYFGKNAAYRFDDPKKGYGACYCGEHLDTAIAETVLHDELPDKGVFKVHEDEFNQRFLVEFTVGIDTKSLRLANLTGAGLKRLGGNNALSAVYPYDITQQWSAAIHAHPDQVDGIYFVSKQLNNRNAVVVFDRARNKFEDATFTPLAKVPGLARAKKALGIVTIGASSVAKP